MEPVEEWLKHRAIQVQTWRLEIATSRVQQADFDLRAAMLAGASAGEIAGLINRAEARIAEAQAALHSRVVTSDDG